MTDAEASPDAVDLHHADELLRVLNSTPIVDGEARDLLEAATPDVVRRVRADLQAVVRGERSAVVLQPLLDGVARRPRAAPAGVTWHLDVDDDRAEAVRLVLTWDHLQRTAPGRLRPCANPACSLFLLDRSRAGRARWCSMAACGNRAKARRHYERQRSAAAPDDD